jgi:hypothetical protein
MSQIGYEVVDWIRQAQNWEVYRALMDAVTNLWFLKRPGISWLRSVMRNRCAAEAIQVCQEIFISHYNYNHNEINNCKNMNKCL